MKRIENQAKPSNTVYLDGKPKKTTVDDFIYLDLEIMELYSRLGGKEAIKYLQDKIKLIKTMEGESK